jgi:multidrug efflux pump
MTLESNSRNILEVSDYASNVILERLQTIPGVSTIQIWGEKKYAMRLWLDPGKLSALNITPLDISKALERENVELPGGKIAGNKTELNVNTHGRLTNVEEFNNLIISNVNGDPVRISDVGYAALGAENEETNLKQSGVPMIGLGIVPQPGSNYIEIADEFYKRFDQLKKDLPKDFKLGIALDNTTFHPEINWRSRRNIAHRIPFGSHHHLPLLPRLVNRFATLDRYSCIPDWGVFYYVPRRIQHKHFDVAGNRTRYRISS